MKFDDGEMVVVRHEYEVVWTDKKGAERRDLRNDMFYAVRVPNEYDIRNGEPCKWTVDSFRVPEGIYIGNLNDIAGYRKLLDAVEARLIARKEASNDV